MSDPYVNQSPREHALPKGNSDDIETRRSSFDYEELLACARGELFARRTHNFCSADADVRPHHRRSARPAASSARASSAPSSTSSPTSGSSLPFHRRPGHAGLPRARRPVAADGLLPRLARRAGPAAGRSSTGEVKFTGMVTPTSRRSSTASTSSASCAAGWCWASRDGWLKADGETIYTAHRPARSACSSRRACRPEPRRHVARRGRCSMRRVVVTGLGIVSSIGNNTRRSQGLAA